MTWFQSAPGNLASFVPRYPALTRQCILRWHEFVVHHAIDCQPDDFRDFIVWVLAAYRGRLVTRALTLPRHHRDRRTIARNLLSLRVYRKEATKLLA